MKDCQGAGGWGKCFQNFPGRFCKTEMEKWVETRSRCIAAFNSKADNTTGSTFDMAVVTICKVRHQVLSFHTFIAFKLILLI